MITRNTTTLERIVDSLYFLLIVVCTLYYRGGGAIKLALIVLLVVLALYEKRKNFGFNKTTLILFAYVIVNIIATVHGMISGNSGEALRSATVNVLWPLLYCIFSGYQISDHRLIKFYRGLCFILTFICVTDTLVLFSGITGISAINSVLNVLNLGGIAGASSGIFFRSDHMYLYAFFSPFILSCFALDRSEIDKTGLSVNYLYGLAMYTALIVLCTGMGAIWLATFAGFLIAIVHSGAYRRRYIFIMMAVFLAAGIVVTSVSYMKQGAAYYIIEDIISRIGAGDSGVEAGTIARINQIAAMLKGWRKNPLLGRGIAASARYLRGESIIEATEFESSYVVIFFQRGLIGLALFITVVIRGIRNLRSRQEAACFSKAFETGLIGILIANAFNPYLASLSSIWILFFPLLTEKNERE